LAPKIIFSYLGFRARLKRKEQSVRLGGGHDYEFFVSKAGIECFTKWHHAAPFVFFYQMNIYQWSGRVFWGFSKNDICGFWQKEDESETSWKCYKSGKLVWFGWFFLTFPMTR
jgi:hypothetical protein